MSRRLPPLNALRAFEAAARHLSFTRAAEELHVTPAAISHQIKGLEDDLGVPLFRRLTRALLLTDAGQAALPPLRAAFEQIEEAVALARAPARTGILTVSAAPSIAAQWLVPRLDRFRSRHPEIDVRIDATMQMVDFARDGIDLAIRYGPGRYPGCRIERLFREEVFPVCAPELHEGPPPLSEPADLRHATLLHHDFAQGGDLYPCWSMWLRAAGVGDVDAGRGPRFLVASLAVQAAIAGQGVALASNVLAGDALASGRLVRPFALSLPVDFAYWVVVPERGAQQPKVQAFRDWLLEEAAAGPGTAGPGDQSTGTAHRPAAADNRRGDPSRWPTI